MDIHYINLDERVDRQKHMKDEFEGVLPENTQLSRWSASKNTAGWIGCIHSHANLLRHMMSKDKSNFYIVLEDDCKINDKDRFKQMFPKYVEYLKQHSSEWDLFLAGGIYVSPHRIVCRDPFIIECDWIACSHFVIYNDKSAKKAIDYADSNKYDVGIDNMNARSNRKRIWVPYPLLCDQLATDTNIGNSKEYIEKIREGFNDVHKRLDNFVKRSNPV